jgi:uncharacterized MAPEG superfamily protein
MKRAIAALKAGLWTGVIMLVYGTVCIVYGWPVENSVMFSGGLVAFLMLFNGFSRD